MMFSVMSIEEQIDEKKFIISILRETILASMHDPQRTLQELNDLIYMENELHRLEGLKKYDRNH